MARNWSPAHAERAYEHLVVPSWTSAREAMRALADAESAEAARQDAVSRELEHKYPALKEH